MRLSFAFATAVLSLASSVVFAHPTRTLSSRAEAQVDDAVPYTNAQRFARGLPPITPPRRRGGALRPRASPGVCSGADIHQGRIKVTTSTGSVRYVSKAGLTRDGTLLTTDNVNDALEVSLAFDGTSPPNYFRIERRNAYNSYPMNIGPLRYTDSKTYDPTRTSYTYLALVDKNPQSPDTPAPAENLPSSFIYNNAATWSESVVWSIGADNVLTASWFNPGQTNPMVLKTYYPKSNDPIYLTNDIALMQRSGWFGPTQLIALTLQFECVPVVSPPSPPSVTLT